MLKPWVGQSRAIITAAALLALWCQPRPAYAEPANQDWGTRSYQYLIVEQDLRVVLEEFGRNVGLRVTLSPAVQGRVKGNMPPGSARAFLDALSRAYGLDWYHDGFALHVSAFSESRSRQLELQDLPFDAAMEGVKAAGLYDPRFQLRPGSSPAVATVSGPPRFVEMVSEAVGTMARKRSRPMTVSNVVHVYHGARQPVEKLTFPGRSVE